MTENEKSCRTTITVRYAECDPMGIAHHSSYLPWLEIGRTDLIARAGRPYRELEREGIFLPVVSLSLEYRRPVRYDDRLLLTTRLVILSPVRAEFRYRILGADGTECTRAVTRHAVTGRDGRVTRMPDPVLALLKPQVCHENPPLE
jgi:acyl-CoA thioester hydrolase